MIRILLLGCAATDFLAESLDAGGFHGRQMLRRILRFVRRVSLAFVVLTLVACTREATLPDVSTAPSASPVASAAASSTPAPIDASKPPLLRLELVARGLKMPSTIAGSTDGSLLVNETRSGLVRVIERDGTLRSAPFLDLSGRIAVEGEQGLLGLAVHPDYEANGRFFVHYTRLSDGGVIVSEFHRAADGIPGDPTSERVLLTIDHPDAYHNGGQLAFGRDGYLYVGLGDGGSSLGDSLGNAQNPHVLLGKILRVDVDSVPATNETYVTPPDNPFSVGGGGAPEVYVLGVRNPWRFSFDDATDALWIADVGEGAYEEVTRLDPGKMAGANLGWGTMEGNHCYNLLPCDTTPFVAPLTEYHRTVGCAVIGGYVYHGLAIPGLAGWYLFADYCTGAIFGVRSDAATAVGKVVEPRVLLDSDLVVSTFGRGADGELYVADITAGTVYRLALAKSG